MRTLSGCNMWKRQARNEARLAAAGHSLGEPTQQQPRRVEPPAHLCCPITCDIMTDPVMAADGRTFERNAIRKWLEDGHEKSPITNLILRDRVLRVNWSVREGIAAAGFPLFDAPIDEESVAVSAGAPHAGLRLHAARPDITALAARVEQEIMHDFESLAGGPQRLQSARPFRAISAHGFKLRLRARLRHLVTSSGPRNNLSTRCICTRWSMDSTLYRDDAQHAVHSCPATNHSCICLRGAQSRRICRSSSHLCSCHTAARLAQWQGGTEECRANRLHDCSCASGAPNSCRASEHHCIVGLGLICRCVACCTCWRVPYTCASSQHECVCMATLYNCRATRHINLCMLDTDAEDVALVSS